MESSRTPAEARAAPAAGAAAGVDVLGNRSADEFFALLSHELRNPLAAADAAVHALELLAVGDAKLERVHGVLERQSQHMKTLLNDLLDLSRISYGLMSLAVAAPGAADLIDGVLEQTASIMQARELELVVEAPTTALCVRGDAERLKQALATLVEHAAHRSPKHGRIVIHVSATADQVEFRISDSGPGLSAQALPRLFDLFSQVAYTSSSRAAGCGLGLPLARRLVQLHAGSIEVHSEGEGLDLVVGLPAATPCEEPASIDAGSSPSAAPPPDKTVGQEILVLDDNVDAAESLALVLSLRGHTVRTAYDGPAALASASAHPPDVVLLDIGLPQMDGYEVARRLRRLEGMESALLVAVTGYDREGDVERSRQAGIDRHLLKPVDLSLLQGLVADRSS